MKRVLLLLGKQIVGDDEIEVGQRRDLLVAAMVRLTRGLIATVEAPPGAPGETSGRNSGRASGGTSTD